MNTLSYILSDCVWLPLLETFIVAVFIWTVIHDIRAKLRKGATGAEVTRGELSWSVIFTFWGLSIILIEIIISSELIADHRVIIGLSNLAVFIYLYLYSVYFKNKIIGFNIKLKKWSQQI
jgi:hypothetical protein